MRSRSVYGTWTSHSYICCRSYPLTQARREPPRSAILIVTAVSGSSSVGSSCDHWLCFRLSSLRIHRLYDLVQLVIYQDLVFCQQLRSFRYLYALFKYKTDTKGTPMRAIAIHPSNHEGRKNAWTAIMRHETPHDHMASVVSMSHPHPCIIRYIHVPSEAS